jgi:hypothetical protein
LPIGEIVNPAAGSRSRDSDGQSRGLTASPPRSTTARKYKGSLTSTKCALAFDDKGRSQHEQKHRGIAATSEARFRERVSFTPSRAAQALNGAQEGAAEPGGGGGGGGGEILLS